ncbi:hypothetical protein ACQR1I_32135 [Bradyrhizobium sp. HKCCYLS2038]
MLENFWLIGHGARFGTSAARRFARATRPVDRLNRIYDIPSRIDRLIQPRRLASPRRPVDRLRRIDHIPSRIDRFIQSRRFAGPTRPVDGFNRISSIAPRIGRFIQTRRLARPTQPRLMGVSQLRRTMVRARGAIGRIQVKIWRSPVSNCRRLDPRHLRLDSRRNRRPGRHPSLDISKNTLSDPLKSR